MFVCLQLLAVYRPLLERPLIKEEFDSNYMELIRAMERELLDVKLLYDRHMEVT